MHPQPMKMQGKLAQQDTANYIAKRHELARYEAFISASCVDAVLAYAF